MKSIRILDCTLRDGGFINDWNFGSGCIKSIISRLDKAGVDIIEIGFIDERRTYDPDRSILPDTKSIDPLMKDIDVKHAMIVGMIDFGTCDISHISPQSESCIDGIRVIFKKKDQDSALAYISRLKELGYKVFVQPVSITGYTDSDVREIIAKINKLVPYAVSIVDTYGLMHTTELLHYFNLFNENLDPSITIGYHSHNNFQMAYSNSIELVKTQCERNIVIDSSLYGMGKGAGNANTELITMYLNENYEKHYDIEQLLEAIDVDIMKEYAKHTWGYSLMYYLAALNDCHPSYVKHLIDKKTLAIKAINEILATIPKSAKLSFSETLIENLFNEFQDKSCNDTESYLRLEQELRGKSILLLGPGKSLIDDEERVHTFISKEKPTTISINFVNDSYDIDYVFMGNAKRYSQFFHKIYGNSAKSKVICTSNISASTKHVDFIFNYGALIVDELPIRDNPLIMLIKILQNCKIKNIYLAGFDGYTVDTSKNYYNEYIPFLFCIDDVVARNSAIAKFISCAQQHMNIQSLTKSSYL